MNNNRRCIDTPAIASMIDPNADGTFTVHHYDDEGNAVSTTVGPFYNHGEAQAGFGDVDPETGLQEIWVMVIEQAMMNYLGGAPTEVVGDGLSHIMTLLTGSSGTLAPSTQYTLQAVSKHLIR